ncbi:glycosyltransferase family 4 protein [Fulvimarina sp. 2208YS6-2-32]|uniref:Glycosyltransferase family 4 protein n=1 Tax=Fulvimarina uroteuthidis TaxID=3098149 RepID=A0ABU5I1W0_9HYPH|nr:glycosyltransferase family 4 protein [Fulvimarina sp. 2208YS6-2-32]MDY8108156.1 glycosyltransferase family 4 protein [Fulvimarina sp. 2208YS6-2-32]
MSIRRTALIAWDYPPSASGLAVAAREIAESLALAGVETSVFTLDRSGDDWLNGVRILGCSPAAPGLSGFARKRMALGHLVAPRWFGTRIAAEHAVRPFDCLEATNWYAPAALACRTPGLPFVTRHSTPAALTGAVSGGLRDRIDGRAACWLEAATARRADGHIFNTQEHGEVVEALYALSARRPNAVVGLSLPPERLRAAAAARYPAAGDGPVELLFVGRPERRKGFDCLTGAVEILSKAAIKGALPAFRLRLVGVTNRDIDGLSDDARRCVEALGFQSEPDLDALYRAAHIVVAPSRYESFGLVYQEALAFGRPVVALAQDASALKVIGASGAGFLASDATGQALADALFPLIGNGALRLQLHGKALQAAGQFDRARLARETLALYEAARDHRRSIR